jgi:hypothetical protein
MSEEYDIEWFRDLTDIVKNKTMFFLPCFGAFLAWCGGNATVIGTLAFVLF